MPFRPVFALFRGAAACAAIAALSFALSVDGAPSPYSVGHDDENHDKPSEVWPRTVDIDHDALADLNLRGGSLVPGYAPFEGQIRFDADEELLRWGGALVGDSADMPEIVMLDDGAAALFRATAPGGVSERTYRLRHLLTGQNDTPGNALTSTPTLRVRALVNAAPNEGGDDAHTTVLRMMSGSDERVALSITPTGALRLELLGLGAWTSESTLTPGQWHELELDYAASGAEAEGDLVVLLDGAEALDLRKEAHGVDAPITAFAIGAMASGDMPGAEAHIRWVRWSHRETNPLRYDPDLLIANIRDVDATRARVVTMQRPADFGWAAAEAFVEFAPAPWPGEGSDLIRATAPVALRAEDGFAAVHELVDLAPGAACVYRVVIRAVGEPATEIASDLYMFRTLPVAPGVIRFGWMSCHEQNGQSHPFDVYSALDNLGVDFIANLGDFHYNDSQPAEPFPANRFEIMNSVRSALLDLSYAAVARTTPQFIMLDDHDVWSNNATDFWANSEDILPDHGGVTKSFLWHEGLAAWESYFRRAMINTGPEQASYRSWETGSTLFVMLDTRSHQRRGAQTMLGLPQRDWLLDLVATTDKPLLVIFSPSVWGDVQDFRDNWEGGGAGGGGHTAFHAERAMIEQAIGASAVEKAIVLSGDRHCSLVHTRLDEPKMLFEACGGPASNNVFTQYSATDAALPGVLFCSTDGAEFPPISQPPGYAHMAGRVVIDEIERTFTVQIVDGDDGRVMFEYTPGQPIEVEVPGDADGDGDVDFADLNFVLGVWQTAGEDIPGDLNGDGHVDFADLNVVLSNFNN